jgi:hypothetical protein
LIFIFSEDIFRLFSFRFSDVPLFLLMPISLAIIDAAFFTFRWLSRLFYAFPAFDAIIGFLFH